MQQGTCERCAGEGLVPCGACDAELEVGAEACSFAAECQRCAGTLRVACGCGARGEAARAYETGLFDVAAGDRLRIQVFRDGAAARRAASEVTALEMQGLGSRDAARGTLVLHRGNALGVDADLHRALAHETIALVPQNTVPASAFVVTT